MEKGTGTIKAVVMGGSAGMISEEGTGKDFEFVNPRIPDVREGERFEFLKIIQSTPQGDKVTVILTKRIP